MEVPGNCGGGDTQRKPITPSRPRRKLSIPVLQQTSTGSGDAQVAFRRRFSNVGDVVSRKFSTTVGWRTGVSVNPPEEVVAVGRGLCSLYIRTKLKKSGLFDKKLGLMRVRSALGNMIDCSNIVRDVFPCLLCACQELERMYPKLYFNISRQTGPPPAEGSVGVLLAVGHHMLRSEPSWGKVIAIYCVAGGLAVDYIRQGQNENLHVILEDMFELLEDRMANWVHSTGGWVGLSAHCRSQIQEVPLTKYMTIFGLATIIILVAYFIIRFHVKFGM